MKIHDKFSIRELELLKKSEIDIDKDYFNRECENWAMMERVKAEGITQQTNLDIDTSIKPLGKEVDLSNYKNVCWDKHHKILTFDYYK